jgi:hypothetical protein
MTGRKVPSIKVLLKTPEIEERRLVIEIILSQIKEQYLGLTGMRLKSSAEVKLTAQRIRVLRGMRILSLKGKFSS